MKPKFLKYFLLLFVIVSAKTIFAQESIEGKWQTGVDNTIIETYQIDGAWFGKIISSDNGKAKMGTDILKDFKADGDTWTGQLYAAKKGKYLDAVITPAGDKLKIKVSSGLMSKNLEWSKVQD